jgi:hypothetical protein
MGRSAYGALSIRGAQHTRDLVEAGVAIAARDPFMADFHSGISTFKMTTEIKCEYCGVEGTISKPDDPDSTLELRNHKFVCKDTAACDRQWEKANPLEDDD